MGDEHRYYGYALHLLEGRYAMPTDSFLWNGPGIPFVILPFVYFGMPITGLRLLNAFFLAGAYFLLAKTLTRYFSEIKSSYIALILGLWPSVFMLILPYFYTEVLCIFLLTAFIFFLEKYRNSKRLSDLIFAASAFGYLILCKVIFFYVAVVCLFIFLLLKGWKNQFSLYFMSVIGLSLLFVMPYFAYTYQQTGKLFYTSNAGGMQLYWMTVDGKSHTGEWHPFPGDWNPYPKSRPQIFENIDRINFDWYQENRLVIDEWKTLDPIAADNFLKQKAISNIKTQPQVFVKNIIFNISRFYFDSPRKGNWRPAWFNFPNLILLLATLIILRNLLTLFKEKNQIPFVLSIMAFVYMGGSFVLSAYARFSLVLIPVLVYVIAFIVFRKTKGE